MLIIVRRSWRSYFVRGALAAAFGLGIGIAALAAPGLTLGVLVTLFGIYVGLEGLFALAAALRHRGEDGWALLLPEGLAGVAIAVLALGWPGVTALALGLFIGVWAVLTGLLQIGAAISLRRSIKGEWLLGLSGLLSIFLGALVLAFPTVGVVAIMWLLGGYAMLFGALLIALGLKARRLQVDEDMVPPHRLRLESDAAS